jgi:hypothetical protein
MQRVPTQKISARKEEAVMGKARPRARRAQLIIEELPDELLVYDQKSHRAHCLNASAASVFRSADGSRTVAEIAAAAGELLGADFGEELTWLALQELDKNDLLDAPLPRVPLGMTRRDLVTTGAAVAVMLPLVLAITAPTPAQAQSGITG